MLLDTFVERRKVSLRCFDTNPSHHIQVCCMTHIADHGKLSKGR